jgi:hypothetical protein
MMARLVHIPYQLFQPNEFDSIISRGRAFEMPEGACRNRLYHFARANLRCLLRCLLARAPTRAISDDGTRQRYARHPGRIPRAPFTFEEDGVLWEDEPLGASARAGQNPDQCCAASALYM